MYTETDLKIVNYLDRLKVAKTSTLIELFFNSYRYGLRRLKLLAERGDLNRARALGVNYDYLYYVGRRPKQLLHSLYLTDFHRELHKISDKIVIKPEYTCGNLRADALVGFEINGKSWVAFVEVQTRNYALDTGKYRQLLLSRDWKKTFPSFPLVVAITDQRIKKPTDYRLVQIKTDIDLSGFLKQL